jgi:hypothetical protein
MLFAFFVKSGECYSPLLLNAIFQSSIKSSIFSNPTEILNKLSGVGLSGLSTDFLCSIKLSTPPKLVAVVNSFNLPVTAIAFLAFPFICTANLPSFVVSLFHVVGAKSILDSELPLFEDVGSNILLISWQFQFELLLAREGF